MTRDEIIRPMTEEDIAPAMALWLNQFRSVVPVPELADAWESRTEDITSALRQRILAGRSVAVCREGELAGYAAYDAFTFHDDPSAFCPFFAHAAGMEHRADTYKALYAHLSRRWVDEKIRTHLITIGTQDPEVRDALFDIGCGAYLKDAFACPGPDNLVDPDPGIALAAEADLPVLMELVGETDGFYRNAPLFLKREPITTEDVQTLMNQGTVFLYIEDKTPVGFLYLGQAEEDDLYAMIPEGCGVIDEIGAYIRPEYRGRGGGRRLLNAAKSACVQQGRTMLHVDFESANLFGNAFWPKHFKTTFLSVRRVVASDVTN